MPKNYTVSALSACALALASLFYSCSSPQHFSQPSLSQKLASQPDYLDELSLNGPERSLSITTERSSFGAAAIDPSKGSSIRMKYAALLNVVPEAIRNVALYRFIDEWYGVRYLFGGETKEGIDCSAFVQKLYEQVFGVNLVRTAIEQAGETRLISKKEQCREGDLVFFKIKKGRISHVGLYLMNDFFVHASSSQGIMISSLDDAYWSKHFACAGRVL